MVLIFQAIIGVFSTFQGLVGPVSDPVVGDQRSHALSIPNSSWSGHLEWTYHTPTTSRGSCAEQPIAESPTNHLTLLTDIRALTPPGVFCFSGLVKHTLQHVKKTVICRGDFVYMKMSRCADTACSINCSASATGVKMPLYAFDPVTFRTHYR